MKEKKIIESFETIKENVKPKPNYVKNCFMAFIFGGIICDIGQLIMRFLNNYNFTKDQIASITSICMIFIGALLTGLGIYAKLAPIAGAGTIVPITGFSNAIVSPAIEFKKEGFVFGVAAKMFSIAGPVLVYGISSSVIIGIIYYIITLF